MQEVYVFTSLDKSRNVQIDSLWTLFLTEN